MPHLPNRCLPVGVTTAGRLALYPPMQVDGILARVNPAEDRAVSGDSTGVPARDANGRLRKLRRDERNIGRCPRTSKRSSARQRATETGGVKDWCGGALADPQRSTGRPPSQKFAVQDALAVQGDVDSRASGNDETAEEARAPTRDSPTGWALEEPVAPGGGDQ